MLSRMSLRCLIVDDSEQFLRAASRVSAGTGSRDRDGDDLGDAAGPGRELRPDAVLVDVGLVEESGFDLTLQLVDAFPYLASRVVLISTRAEDDYANSSTRARLRVSSQS